MERSTIFVKVNLQRFVENARREGESLTLEQAKLYLMAWGMRLCRGNLWRCNDVTVTYFKPDEVEQQIHA